MLDVVAPPSMIDFGRGVLREAPFPYLVIDNALPEALYQELSASYPSHERLAPERMALSNHRLNLAATWGAAEYPLEAIAPSWRRFLEAHSSTAFAERVCAALEQTGGGAQRPGFFRVDELGAGLARKLNLPDYVRLQDLEPRATVAVNTPVREMSRVRGPHVDAARKAYVGLLYFRPPEDTSDGGNLLIYRWRDGAKADPWSSKIDDADVEIVDEIAYAPNRLVLFLNRGLGVHGVSPREITPHYRRLVVLSGWLPGVNFHDTDSTKGRLHGIFSTARAKLTRLRDRLFK